MPAPAATVSTSPRRRPLDRSFNIVHPRVQLPKKFTSKKLRGLRFGVPAQPLQVISHRRARTGTNFALLAGETISARAGVSRDAAMIEAIRRQTPFETYRPRLWHMLTHR